MNGDRTYSYAISSRRFLLAHSCLNSAFTAQSAQFLPFPLFAAGRFVVRPASLRVPFSFPRFAESSRCGLLRTLGFPTRQGASFPFQHTRPNGRDRTHTISPVLFHSRPVCASPFTCLLGLFLLARRSRVRECQRTVSSPFLAGLGALNAIYVIQARKHGSLLAISVKRGRKQGERTYAISNPLASLVRVPFMSLSSYLAPVVLSPAVLPCLRSIAWGIDHGVLGFFFSGRAHGEGQGRRPVYGRLGYSRTNAGSIMIEWMGYGPCVVSGQRRVDVGFARLFRVSCVDAFL